MQIQKRIQLTKCHVPYGLALNFGFLFLTKSLASANWQILSTDENGSDNLFPGSQGSNLKTHLLEVSSELV